MLEHHCSIGQVVLRRPRMSCVALNAARVKHAAVVGCSGAAASRSPMWSCHTSILPLCPPGANMVMPHDVPAGAVVTQSINACLAPVGNLAGCSITTASGLGNSREGYHPIQGKWR
jgi:hypothetical protein